MKLLVATPLYPPEPGGPATYVRRLEEGLPPLGIEVSVAKFGDVRRRPKLIRHLSYLFMLLARGRGAAALLVQDTVSCGLPAAIAARLLRIPLIVRVPGDYAWEQARERWGVTADIDSFQRSRAPWQAELLRAVQRWVVGSAARVIVPSRYFASVVSGWGVVPERLRVIYHGLAFPLPVEKLSERPSGNLLVSIGRLVPWKGFDFLIRLMPSLPGWRLVIVGDGPERGRLEHAASDAGVRDRVAFAGALPREQALGWLAVADAFALATSFESFSFQIVEAMALGVPVITTPVGSIPELMQDGVEGALCALGDAESFVRAIESEKDAALWKPRTQNAIRRARTFSQERMLNETAALVREVAGH